MRHTGAGAGGPAAWRVAFAAPGPPEVLRVEPAPAPAPGPGQARVRGELVFRTDLPGPAGATPAPW